jgi:N-acyl-D-aspartate/D-glutamate deacylase
LSKKTYDFVLRGGNIFDGSGADPYAGDVGHRRWLDCRDRNHRRPIIFGLKDRGLVAPGYRAHLNVIDYARLNLHKPQVVADFPAGVRRLQQRADAYVATIVNGQVISRDGRPTQNRPGSLIRDEQAPKIKMDSVEAIHQ